MCSSCYNDPAMDRIHYQRQGMVEVSDFDEEPRYRHPKRRAKKSRARSLTRTPCPVAEDGKHVYIWEPYESVWTPRDKVFRRYFGYYKKEILTCCGCMATKGIGRDTERYAKVKERKWRKLTGGEYDVKRGEPVSRYRRWRGSSYYSFVWESYDEGYQKALADWEETKEAERFRKEAEYRRIAMRRKWLGYTD